MLEFIVGRAGTGKTNACLSALREEMEARPLGPSLILLVPEHMTYQMERELAASMPRGKGFFRASIQGFRRFAGQVLAETGGADCPRITEVGRRLLLRRLLGERKEELSFFARAARQRGFSGSLSEMIQEFKSYRLTPEILRRTAEEIEGGQLSEKLSELAMLSEDFASAMEGRQTDAEDMMEALAERIPRSEMLEGAEVYVDGFIFFNPQEREVLKALMQKAANVHVTLSMVPEKEFSENRHQTGLFNRSYETFLMLWNMAGELKLERRVKKLDHGMRFLKPALQAVEERLFRYPYLSLEEGEGVHILEAANRRIEVEAVVSDILRLCREEGYRYGEIGILLRDQEAYGGLLSLVMEDHGIPFFEDRKRSAIHHPLAELIRSSLELLHGWRYEAVFRCLRTGFFGIPWEQLDQLENYVLEFGIRGAARWTMEEPWKWYRRSLDDEGEEISESTASMLAEVDTVRRQAAELLAPFGEEVRKAGTVREITAAVYHLLTALRVPEQLQEWVKRSEEQGMMAMSREHGQIWEDVIELLEQFTAISGDEEMDLREYEGILGEGLDALEMSLIPPGLDYVTVSSFDQNSLFNARAIYILGANEGIMPRRAREKGLLSDGERLRLRESGLEISAGGQEGIFAEKFLLYRGFTEAREYLWVSYALADAEGTGLAPSSILLRLRQILRNAEFVSLPLESMELDGGQEGELSRREALRLADGRRAVSGLARALRGRKEGRDCPSWWQDVYNWLLEREELARPRELALQGLFAKGAFGELPGELVVRLFARNRKLRGSVTRFEGFRSCPFRHFARHGLRLQERKERKFLSPDLGNLLHSALREFGTELKAQGRRWRDVGDEECHDMLDGILDRLAPKLQNELLLSTMQFRHQLMRIRILAERSVRRLIAFDRVSSFHPESYERSFGRGPGAMPPLTYELGDVRLEIIGQIDRMDLDESGKYFMIMDYKTGQAYINLLEVYYGLKMQLLTYLLAARNLLKQTEKSEVMPAGMLYFFLRYPMYQSSGKISPEEARKKIENDLKMPGWILAEPEVVKAIDSTQQFIKVKLNKDESIGKTSLGSVRSREEFDLLLEYIDYLLEDTGKRIMKGEIAPRPIRLPGGRTACSYCEYRLLCGFDPAIEGYGWQDLPKLEDGEIMDSIEWTLREKGKAEGGEAHGMDKGTE